MTRYRAIIDFDIEDDRTPFSSVALALRDIAESGYLPSDQKPTDVVVVALSRLSRKDAEVTLVQSPRE